MKIAYHVPAPHVLHPHMLYKHSIRPVATKYQQKKTLHKHLCSTCSQSGQQLFYFMRTAHRSFFFFFFLVKHNFLLSSLVTSISGFNIYCFYFHQNFFIANNRKYTKICRGWGLKKLECPIFV